MRLARIQLDRYGPLAGLDAEVDPGIQLIHGPNESGKTLLVEGLLTLATGRQPAGARVDGEAVGRLTVASEGADGAEPERTTVDGETTLLDVYERRHGYAFTPAEFRNVFAIRDGDLDVDGDYYESVTQQLTGLRSEDIRALQERVRELGRITREDKRLKDAKPYGYPKRQCETARELLEDVRGYLQRAREESLDDVERELFRARRRVADIEEEVAALEAAVERDRIAGLDETVERLERALEERSSLPTRSSVEDLERELDDLATRTDAEPALERRLEIYRPVVGLTLLLAIMSVAATLLADLGPLGPVVPVVGVLAAVLAAVRWGRTNRRLATIEGDRARVLRDARDVGLEPTDVDDLRATVAAIAERREEADATVNQAVGELRGTLDVSVDDPAEVVETATERLEERAAGVPAEVEIEGPVDVDRLAERERELSAARKEVSELDGALDEHRERLEALGRRASGLDFDRFTDEPLDVEVTSLESLSTLRDRLEGFVETIEREARVARTAHDVLAGMAASESEKVTSLFGPGSRASEVFRLVTDGRYDAVEYDAEADSLVVTGQGEPLAPRALSQGTRDQLFFAVRVGLAEQLLGGEQGVLVLDDAFVAADPARLDRQVHVLERLADAGWQVLYLTAKADAVDRLAEHCEHPVRLDAL